MLAQDERLEITLEEIFSIQGGDAQVIQERRPALYAQTERARAEALTLLAPDLVYRRLAVTGFEANRIFLDGGFSLTSTLLARRFALAEAVCVAICTIGERISVRATQLMADNQYSYGYALDCAGTVALESLAKRLHAWVEAGAAAEGLKVSRRYSPGLRSWPVTIGQPEIFAVLCNENQIVELTPSMQMLPLKSVSFVVGLGQNMKQSGSECSDCSMRDRCTSRDKHDQKIKHAK